MMKKILMLVLILISISSWSQQTSERIIRSIPTIEQEATSVWRTINDIQFFEKQGYIINLPHSESIDSMIVKSKNRTFGSQDYSTIYELLELKAYTKDDYKQAFEKVRKQEQLINCMIQLLDSLKSTWNWEFKIFEKYEVVFTLYGSGGSYDPSNGIITLFATKDGQFKKYKNPANTIIHEIVHIGIEESIVQHYHLSHALKERIVDRMVFLLFKDLLPEYEIQNMGDSNIDKYLKDKSDIKNLDKILEEYKG